MKLDWRKKNEATVKSISVDCACGKTHRLNLKKSLVIFSSRDQDCDLCGSHGDTTMEYWCPDNPLPGGRSLKVTLSEH